MELGLIDEIGGLSDALTCLHKMIERRNREEPAGLRDRSEERRGGRGGRRGANVWEGGDERGKIRAIGRCKRVFFPNGSGRF